MLLVLHDGAVVCVPCDIWNLAALEQLHLIKILAVLVFPFGQCLVVILDSLQIGDFVAQLPLEIGHIGLVCHAEWRVNFTNCEPPRLLEHFGCLSLFLNSRAHHPVTC